MPVQVALDKLLEFYRIVDCMTYTERSSLWSRIEEQIATTDSVDLGDLLIDVNEWLLTTT